MPNFASKGLTVDRGTLSVVLSPSVEEILENKLIPFLLEFM